MNWIYDNTGRFSQRPFYERRELNDLAEARVSGFLGQRYSAVHYPLSTEDLTVLVEEESSDLDLFADLSPLGENIEGVTLFPSDAKPAVRVSRHLADPLYINRQRSTLAHELGHVLLHARLWPHGQMALLPAEPAAIRCARGTILRAAETDWLEWQAGYFSGAVLMPLSAVREVTGTVLVPLAIDSSSADAMLARIRNAFLVSLEAAQVRLLQLGFITAIPQPLSFFDKQDGVW